MEKKFFIIRHGKSSWENLVDDIDRPLIDRGIKGAYMIADRLKEEGLIPEKGISSPAARALHTASIVARVTGMKEGSLSVNNELYLAEVKDILKLVRETPEDISSLAVFGHNPGFTELANRFLPEAIENLPTAGVVVVSFRGGWKELDPGNVTGIYIDYPKKQD